MPPCPFCDIIQGHPDRLVIHEDAHTIAFMPARPLHEGHVLVMPKAHHPEIFQLTTPELDQLFGAARRIAEALKRLYAPPKVAVLSAGLLVEHAHPHLLPVFGPHDLTSPSELEGTTPVRTSTELRALAAAVQAALQPPA
ncbi:MAG TPA: HIT family protein [Holophaga sp.]|nr:HIT family protein [Holophaga sp.]